MSGRNKGLPAVTELVPHEHPVLALDELTSWQEGEATGRLTVRADNPLAHDGVIDSVMALEYIAQCVAACLGMEAYAGGGNVRVGMVVACRKMTLHQPHLKVGKGYVVDVRQVRGTDSISHYDGDLRDERGKPIASCTMTLVHGEKPPE